LNYVATLSCELIKFKITANYYLYQKTQNFADLNKVVMTYLISVIYRVAQKTAHYTLVHNFAKY